MTQEATISVHALTKRFGADTVVHDLSFEVRPKEALALWGPNGAGKTTVIKCLLGLLEFQGEIMVANYSVRRRGRQVRNLLGYVPQELAFYEDMTILESVHFFARLRKTDPARAQSIVQQVDLTEHAHKAVGALSGGLKQRLALGLALVSDPPVLVLDEPTANLDAGVRTHFLDLLQEVKAEGKTLLFTSHRLDEVEHLADQVLVMERGVQRFICGAAELAARLQLQNQIKLHLPAALLDQAVTTLCNRGFQAQRNGSGVLVTVPINAKAAPIHTLSQAGIVVTDMEMESTNHA